MFRQARMLMIMIGNHFLKLGFQHFCMLKKKKNLKPTIEGYPGVSLGLPDMLSPNMR